MMQPLVYIALGSNLDNPRQHISQALQEIQQLPNCEWVTSASLYRSKPMGPADQPDYINSICAIRTQLEPLQLLDQLQSIEQGHARLRDGPRWGPRTLDLDIVLFGENVINSERLTVPHPGLDQRSFVLYPLYEIAPDLVIPGRGALRDLLDSVDKNELEKLSD